MQIIGLIDRLHDRTQTESETKSTHAEELTRSSHLERKKLIFRVTLLKNLIFFIIYNENRRLKLKFQTVQTITFQANKNTYQNCSI